MEVVSNNYADTKIFIKNRYIVSETNSRYDIRSSKNKTIFFQTKKVSFYINTERNFVLVFFPKEDPLLNVFRLMEKNILKFLAKNGYNKSEYTWYSPFNLNSNSNFHGDDVNDDYISMFFRISKHALSFDHHRETYDINENMRSYGRLLLGVKHIWISNSSCKKMYGIQVELEQFEIDTDYVFDNYAFIENSENGNYKKSKQNNHDTITFQQHSVYAKYFTMLQKGVPKMAVLQKISMNGDPPEILDYSLDDPIPLNLNCHKNSTHLGNLNIKKIDGFDLSQLKKVKDKPSKKIIISGQCGHAPSLETILDCLNRLKPVISNDTKEIERNNKKFGYLQQIGLIE